MCVGLTNETPVGIVHNIIYYYNKLYIYIVV